MSIVKEMNYQAKFTVPRKMSAQGLANNEDSKKILAMYTLQSEDATGNN